ncbi:hypothetical protein GCM10023189_55920 [Nibrella saemangeumensis]|uniref:Uncharacterized protein n=1 Tax=Nibrella saemangeumensis TaxID=1084526 RepID=A0ABP8NQ48_9BACT
MPESASLRIEGPVIAILEIETLGTAMPESVSREIVVTGIAILEAAIPVIVKATIGTSGIRSVRKEQRPGMIPSTAWREKSQGKGVDPPIMVRRSGRIVLPASGGRIGGIPKWASPTGGDQTGWWWVFRWVITMALGQR